MEFDEKPEYEKMKFMLKKILIEKNFIPDNKFDWSLGPGQSFRRVNNESRHSSISSCDLNSDEANFDEDISNREKQVNLKRFKELYHSSKQKGDTKFKQTHFVKQIRTFD